MSLSDQEIKTPGFERQTGDTVFAGIILLISLFLLSQMWSQTVSAGSNFAANPAFWPRLAVSGMVFFAAINLIGSFRDPSMKERWTGLGEEVVIWARSIEYALWFMAYVMVTPYLGYLPTTIIFALAMSLRAGYRTRPVLLAALGAALAVVILFKSFLQVRIPGGALYEYLPDAIRNFFILYL